MGTGWGDPSPALALGSSSNGTGRAGAGRAAGTMCTASFSLPELVVLPDPGRGGKLATSAQFPFIWANPWALGPICRLSLSSPQRSSDKKVNTGLKSASLQPAPSSKGSAQLPWELPGLGRAPVHLQATSEHPEAPAAPRGSPSSPAVRRLGRIMASGGWPGEERRGAALYSPVLTSISVCPAQVIPTIKILLLIPLHPPHFAGKLPRSPLCLHSTFLQKGQGRTSPS